MAFDDDDIEDLEFTAAGESEEDRKRNLKMVEPSPGFDPMVELVADSIIKDALITVLDYTPQQVSVRYQIDGLWHPGPPMDRETGDYMLASMKQIAGMEYRERGARQEGSFGTLYKKARQKFKVVSQGVPTGERVAIYLDYKRPAMDSITDQGMRGGMVEQLKTILQNPKTGLVLCSAVPGEGYTTAWRGMLGACDRLTRDYYVLEEVGKNEPEVINIYPVEFNPKKGEDALTPVPQLMLKEPDVLAFPEIPDGRLLNRIVDHSIQHDIPIFLRNPGRTCVDAVLRMLVKQPDVEKFASRLDAVICMRVIRTLCDDCKVGFQPHPQMLQRLGLPPGRVAQLYSANVYQPDSVDEDGNEIEPCESCSGIGFRGRTGLWELLTVTDEFRKALLNQPRIDKLTALVQKAGHVTMQTEGVLMVAKGVVSLDEVQRVLKS
ncbi:MAG: ATPase, T2SS/T4P/T4SS family [Planctomycetota bacterium]